MSFGLFADSGLTVPLESVDFLQAAGGAPAERLIYVGSADADRQLRAASDPGVDPVELHVIDTDEQEGLEPAAVRLALTAGGLDTATPGAPLVLGTVLTSGAANAVAVFVRVDSGASEPAVFDDLLFRIPDVIEGDV